MKFKILPPDLTPPTFGDLQPGDAFIWNTIPWMKIWAVDNGLVKRNTIRLDTGEITYFADHTQVTPKPNSEVVLK